MIQSISTKTDFYIFCAFDEWYADLSYVFFASFNQYNSDKILHVHCINFSEEKYLTYKNIVSKYFKNVITELYSQPSNDKYVAVDDRELTVYAAHTEVLEHKIKFWAASEYKHILYLDIDMLVRGDVSLLLKDATTNVIGSRHHKDKGYGYNAGVIVINQPDNPTMLKQYNALLTNLKDKLTFPEEYLLDNLTDYTRGEFADYLHCVPQSREFDKDKTVIAHFYPVAIKLWDKCTDKLVQTIFGTRFSICANEWYALYDKVKALNILSDRFCKKVDSKRSYINNLIALKTKADNRRQKLYGSVLR